MGNVSILQEIPRALCLRVNTCATVLDDSWPKRWTAITSYDLTGCLQTIVDLQEFFDQGFQFAPNSQRTSFYQNEVILTDHSKLSVYGCNYLNKQTRKLDMPVQGTIENIYCYKNSLIVLSSTSVIVYDFTAKKSRELPSVIVYDFTAKKSRELPILAMEALADDLEECVVGFYDKKNLLLLGKKGTYIIDVTKGDLCASGQPIPAGCKRDGMRAPQHFFASQETIVGAKEGILDVYRGRELSRDGMVWLPADNWTFAEGQSIIDGSSYAYCATRTFGGIVGGTDLYLGEYSTGGVVDDPKSQPLSTVTIRQRFYLPEAYTPTAIWASKQVCVVGLEKFTARAAVDNRYQLAIWDYHEVKLIPLSERVNHILVLAGKIITSRENSTTFRVLDFTGASAGANDGESVSEPKTLTQEFSQQELKKAKRRFSLIPPLALFGFGLAVLVLIGYAAHRSLRALKNW